MPWYHYLLQFLSGVLLTNGIPHFVHGLSGAPFQSPFAKPPGVGESSALVNVYWGFANLVGGAVLLTRFAPVSRIGWLLVAVGVLLMGTGNATHFAKVRASKSHA
ncbi:MAG TPA: hypothetical protein VN947_35285 [Polyangia bacterium]|nr:hypothetical protein [Polyangia bacterium]